MKCRRNWDRWYQKMASKFATLYLEKFPRKECYGVSLLCDEDWNIHMTLYYEFSDEELKILQHCSSLAHKRNCMLDEILFQEDHQELVVKLLYDTEIYSLDRIESIDLENPVKFTYFSVLDIKDDGTIGRKDNRRAYLSDEEFKEILKELLIRSNNYSMNMLVYHKPKLCQKIMQQLTHIEPFHFESTNPYMADMNELKSVCEGILNPFKDILGIFNSEDEEIKEFTKRKQIVPECGISNDIYTNDELHEVYDFHVQMFFQGTKIQILWEKYSLKDPSIYAYDDFVVEATDVMDRFGIETPEDIYPYLVEHYNCYDCFSLLRKELVNQNCIPKPSSTSLGN